MRIAVMSDLHDNISAWDLILVELNREHITTLINCGDTASASTLRRLAQNFPGAIHDIFGNNADPEQQEIVGKEFPNLFLHGDQGAISIEGVQIGFTHFPEVAKAMIATQEFDLVCHGHTHLKRWEKIGNCFVINPGTAGGVFQYPSFATIDLPDMKARFIDLKL